MNLIAKIEVKRDSYESTPSEPLILNLDSDDETISIRVGDSATSREVIIDFADLECAVNSFNAALKAGD